jgi:hypothetical protein
MRRMVYLILEMAYMLLKENPLKMIMEMGD